MERTEIKPAGDDDFLGTNLNEESWVPFNENEPVTDTRLPPRPDPTVGLLSPEQQQQLLQHWNSPLCVCKKGDSGNKVRCAGRRRQGS